MSESGNSIDSVHQASVRKSSGRLVRRTFVIALVLVSSGLLAGGAFELYKKYLESVESNWILQREMAQGASFKIQQFVQEVEKTMLASTQSADILSDGLTDAFEFQLIRLLKIIPAISAIAALDAKGSERIKVSRLEMVRPEDLKVRSTDQAFLKASKDATYVGPVYFVHESEPYAQIAVPIKRFTKVVGVLIAEVNLKHIWKVISGIRAGETGYAYVVSRDGNLVAHPDISMVLKGRNLNYLDQVQAALADTPGPLAVQSNFAGQTVFVAYSLIPDLGWAVLVERPTEEAYAPLYSSLLRTGVLLLVGVGMAVLASLLIGLRVVRPLHALRQGATRIGAGELDHRIDIKTGDELEVLADEFNQMTAKLKESYAVNERVSQLKRFFSPNLAELIVSSGEEKLTESHRQEITVVFCDLRNFTAFSSASEPEIVMKVLQEYYQVICSQLLSFEATIEHFAGDGLMAFFNDPLPCPDPEARAVRMAVIMQQDVGELIEGWRERGIDLGFGIGISSGYATLGHIGSEEQFHYAAIGNVANLASRLCDEARSGQTLITEEIYAKVGEFAKVKSIGELPLKGFPKPVKVLQLIGIENENSTNSNL
jgi:class 3 adenylate cyclase